MSVDLRPDERDSIVYGSFIGDIRDTVLRIQLMVLYPGLTLIQLLTDSFLDYSVPLCVCFEFVSIAAHKYIEFEWNLVRCRGFVYGIRCRSSLGVLL